MEGEGIAISPEIGGRDLVNLLRSNPARVRVEDVLRIMESSSPFYAQTVFFLSETNKVIFWETYRKTLIFKNYDSFGEEEMYYLCEAAKNQILQGLDDFYLVMHHFFGKLEQSAPLQGLFVFLLGSFGSEMRELILTHGILENIVKSSSVSQVFKLKVIKKVLETDHPIMNEYLISKRFRMTVKSPSGCMEYFRRWYKDHFLIEIRFI